MKFKKGARYDLAFVKTVSASSSPTNGIVECGRISPTLTKKRMGSFWHELWAREANWKTEGIRTKTDDNCNMFAAKVKIYYCSWHSFLTKKFTCCLE